MDLRALALAASRFPNPRKAPGDRPLAFGGDLTRERLLAAYASGIFPWYSEGEPILWWSPEPRYVLTPDGFRASDSLRREVRKPVWRVTADVAFRRVIEKCAAVPRPGQDGTWITPEMIAAYVDLHDQGFAHSIEVWQGPDLVGGLYGVALGRVFSGESMFHTAPNASKVALWTLVGQLRRWSFLLIDCQMETAHLARFGGRNMARSEFLDVLTASLRWPTRQHSWRLDDDWPDQFDPLGEASPSAGAAGS